MQPSDTDVTHAMRRNWCKMQCITTPASPNCLFLGMLLVSILIQALFNCLMVILNLFIFNLPWAWRNGNSALGDHLTEQPFSEWLSPHGFFSLKKESVKISGSSCANSWQMAAKALWQEWWIQCASPSLILPPSSSILCSGSSLPCMDHSQLEASWRYNSGKTWASKSCRWMLGQELIELVKTCKKGLKEHARSPGEFSSHGITVSAHGNAPGEGRSALFMSQQSPDIQSSFRSGESAETPHSHGQVRPSGGRVNQQI